MMDYRDILKKYIEHSEEFNSSICTLESLENSHIKFSFDEIEELRKIVIEIYGE